MNAARFVIESPFQLLMANEARKQMDLQDSVELVVLWPTGQSSIQSITDVLDAERWPTIVDGGPRSARHMLTRSKLIRELGSRPLDQLFIGDYLSPFMRHLCVKQPSGSAWLIDDGRGTVNTWRLRTLPNSEHPRPDTRTLRRRVELAALRLDYSDPEILRYFTIFDLESSRSEQVEHNTLSWLRDRMPDTEPDGSILFLGSAFAERGMMSEDRYVSLLSQISNASPAVRYRPHRDEGSAKLQRLRDEAGVEVVDAGGTIELALTQSPSLPSKIMSFFSSAAVTLQKLLGDRIVVGSYALAPSDFTEGWFATGDGLPTLLDQTKGQILVEAIPGRDQSDVERYIGPGHQGG